MGPQVVSIAKYLSDPKSNSLEVSPPRKGSATALLHLHSDPTRSPAWPNRTSSISQQSNPNLHQTRKYARNPDVQPQPIVPRVRIQRRLEDRGAKKPVSGERSRERQLVVNTQEDGPSRLHHIAVFPRKMSAPVPIAPSRRAQTSRSGKGGRSAHNWHRWFQIGDSGVPMSLTSPVGASSVTSLVPSPFTPLRAAASSLVNPTRRTVVVPFFGTVELLLVCRSAGRSTEVDPRTTRPTPGPRLGPRLSSGWRGGRGPAPYSLETDLDGKDQARRGNQSQLASQTPVRFGAPRQDALCPVVLQQDVRLLDLRGSLYGESLGLDDPDGELAEQVRRRDRLMGVR